VLEHAKTVVAASEMPKRHKRFTSVREFSCTGLTILSKIEFCSGVRRSTPFVASATGIIAL
jgi:hypothetical protein